jgi:hypothetical protein
MWYKESTSPLTEVVRVEPSRHLASGAASRLRLWLAATVECAVQRVQAICRMAEAFAG